MFREPVIVQKYVPAVREGDKRIILIDGKPVGAINRIPAAGESRSNMHVGGRPVASTLTQREREICDTIGPELARRGMLLQEDPFVAAIDALPITGALCRKRICRPL